MLYLNMRKFFLTCAFFFVQNNCLAITSIDTSSSVNSRYLAIESEILDKKLYNEDAWKRLVFYRNKPEVVSKDFYYSNLKTFSPKDEMLLTAKAYLQDSDVKCKYPARIYWLSNNLESLDIERIEACENLPKIQDISFVMVGGYLGSPASSFGHILIKTKEDASNLMLDSSINYGAAVPRDENSILYIVKGLFGFYTAGFSKDKFYLQDAVYSKSENRDMWEYQLKLNEDQKKLLNYFLYEVQSANTKYFFLKKNCGYRVAEMLELITGISVVGKYRQWYPPEILFHKMEASDKDIISLVRYIPSMHNFLLSNFSSFNKNQKYTINQSIKSNEALNIRSFNGLLDDEKMGVLNFLAKYYLYKSNNETNEDFISQREEVLKLRFSLPAKTDNHKVTPLVRPSSGPSPSKVTVSLSKEKLYVDLMAFEKTLLNPTNNTSSDFSIGGITTSIDKNKNVRLENILFLDILELNNTGVDLHGENGLAWHVKFEVDRDELEKKLNAKVTTGLGKSVRVNEKVTLYGLLELEGSDNIDVESVFGLLYKEKEYAMKIDLLQQLTYDQRLRVNVEARYSLSKNVELKIERDKKINSIGMSLYW